MAGPKTPQAKIASATKPSKAPISLPDDAAAPNPSHAEMEELKAQLKREMDEKLTLQNQLASVTGKLHRARMALAKVGARSDGDITSPPA